MRDAYRCNENNGAGCQPECSLQIDWERPNLDLDLDENPSLRKELEDSLPAVYKGVAKAFAREMRRRVAPEQAAKVQAPSVCPYSFDQVMPAA